MHPWGDVNFRSRHSCDSKWDLWDVHSSVCNCVGCGNGLSVLKEVNKERGNESKQTEYGHIQGGSREKPKAKERRVISACNCKFAGWRLLTSLCFAEGKTISCKYPVKHPHFGKNAECI